MNQVFSTNVSFVLTLLAAIMWGSWMMVTKFKKDYPIAGITFWLYTFSMILIGGISLIVIPRTLDVSFGAFLSENRNIILRIVFSGMLMSAGMYFNLQVISSAGLLLASAISTSIGNVLGVITTLLTEGLPANRSAVLLYAAATLMFISGGIVCNLASDSHDRDIGKPQEKKTLSAKVLLFAVLSAILANGWAMGTSLGTASNFPPIMTCLFMAFGCFLSIAIICAITFTRNRQWKQVLCMGHASRRPILLGAIAACCHYGGNLISLYCMPALSATLSFLLGRVYCVITIIWGLLFKEFAGSSRKTAWLLFAGLFINILALAILGFYTVNT